MYVRNCSISINQYANKGIRSFSERDSGLEPFIQGNHALESGFLISFYTSLQTQLRNLSVHQGKHPVISSGEEMVSNMHIKPSQ